MTSQMQEPISETAGHVAQQAGEKLDQAVDLAKQQTTSRLENERERVADSLYTTAHALRQVGQQLRDQEQETIASAADRAAQQAERASGYLRSRELPDIINDTEQLGRSHPMLFMGGALGLGLLGVRFLKSSRRQQAIALPESTSASAPSTYMPPASYEADAVLVESNQSTPFSAQSSIAAAQTDEFTDMDEIDGEYNSTEGEEQTLGAAGSRSARERR